MKKQNRKKWEEMSKVEKIIGTIGVVIVGFIVLIIISGIIGAIIEVSSNRPKNVSKIEQETDKKSKPQNEKSDKQEESRIEKSLADKVNEQLATLDDLTKSSIASTSASGYQGEIIGAENDSKDTVKVNVSTYFKDTGDKNDGGKNIARNIFTMVCREVPELNSLYVVSMGSGLESRSVYRKDVPHCKL